LCQGLIETGLIVLGKKIFEDFFSNIHTCKNGFPIVSPPDPRGMICTNLNLLYIRKHLCKSEVCFGFVVLEKIFKWPYPIFEFLG
jgi:hypothetical protein